MHSAFCGWKSFENFIMRSLEFFRDQADSDKGHEGGGMAEAGGQKEEEKG